MSRELLQRALDALELINHRGNTDDELFLVGRVMTEIRAELESPDIDDSLTAAFMLGFQAAKNDYGRAERVNDAPTE